MNVLVVDLTHGGLKIILELIKGPNEYFQEFWAWDIYNTLNKSQKALLIDKGVKLISGKNPHELAKLGEITRNRNNFRIIAPIHCPIEPDFNLKPDLTHHQAVKLILDKWKKSHNIPVIEVTGVKGKTSTVGMLKEILKYKKPLILSSLGAEIIDKQSEIVLKKNISITPASIIETVQMTENPDLTQTTPGICIFETSLGGTGMADIGILTNIAEDYSIAQGKSRASAAKSQIFNSKITCCESEAFYAYYSELASELEDYKLKYSGLKDNSERIINTFSLKDPTANLKVISVDYGLKTTKMDMVVQNLKTINQNIINEYFSVETFAPAPHHVNNVLAAISGALSLGISTMKIQKGIKNFKGLKGRTSLKSVYKSTIIEEINPGINVNAIEKTIEMAQDLDNFQVILGGQYGITCEEIDETQAALLLDDLIKKSSIKSVEGDLILTEELGKGIMEKMTEKVEYTPHLQDALNDALQKEIENIVVIYRSNYSNLKQR